MKQLVSRYIVVIAFISMTQPILSQEGWDWKDPVDLDVIDFADNKLLAYNLLGMGAIYLFDKSIAYDSSSSLQISTAYYQEYQRAPLSDILAVSIKGGKRWREYLTIGAEGHLYGMITDGHTSPGLGASVWFSWHIVRSKSFRLSYDNGVGPNFFFEPFPAGGTRVNFTSHYGVDMAFRVRSNWLEIRFSNIHISNADIKGRARNPALDAIGIRLSYGI